VHQFGIMKKFLDNVEARYKHGDDKYSVLSEMLNINVSSCVFCYVSSNVCLVVSNLCLFVFGHENIYDLFYVVKILYC
jgi:hypothetical protein